MKRRVMAAVALAAIVAFAGTGDAASRTSQATVYDKDLRTKQLEFNVENALLRLPYYDVFDNLGFEVGEKGTVRLVGQVRTATLRRDAERAVKRLAGVEKVVNEIEILPVNIGDDRIRRAVYRALFNDSSLDRYALGAHPSIRIIVKHGRVTLAGIVNNQMDKTMAEFKARGVFGVFGVTNNLAVEKS